MGTGALAVDTGRMDSILIYCRPRASARAHTLRAWLEHQAAELSAGPGIGHTTVVHLTTPSADGPRKHGWLLDCELVDAACPPGVALRELLTDMRLVGFDPIIFTAQPQPRLTTPGAP
jgi:hypothetical protein